jgi:hypothetical protein
MTLKTFRQSNIVEINVANNTASSEAFDFELYSAGVLRIGSDMTTNVTAVDYYVSESVGGTFVALQTDAGTEAISIDPTKSTAYPINAAASGAAAVMLIGSHADTFTVTVTKMS